MRQYRFLLQLISGGSMAATIHVHTRVEKALEQMAIQDNAPKIAAQRARAVIKALMDGIRITRAGRLSMKKETRLRNVFKFNLGKGFRLISIKEKDVIYVMFVGTHDHCDRWLDANRKKKPHMEPIPTSSYGVAKKNTPKTIQTNRFPDDALEEIDLLPELSQEDLRRVFCGLVGSS